MRLSDLTAEQQATYKTKRAEYGKIGVFYTDDQDLVLVRKANSPERVRYLSELGKRKEDPNIAEANRDMALGVIVYPETVDEKTSLLKRFPFLIEDVTAKAVDLAGAVEVDLGND